jgi:hypothetical protein
MPVYALLSLMVLTWAAAIYASYVGTSVDEVPKVWPTYQP